MGPWINVMDARFNLHLRADKVAEVFWVTKPTRTGPAVSVEAFDAAGELILQIFGWRKDGDSSAWEALAASLPAAAAAPVDFFGTWMNTNPTAKPNATCGGQPGVINKHAPPTFKAAGFSNIGDFSFNLFQCVTQPPPNGTMEFDFGGGNTLFGNWGSVGTPTGTPLVSQLVGESTITGGTGSFAGYTGSISALGYLDRRDSVVHSDWTADSAFVFRGQLMQVPEPATYALMLAGLGFIAFAARARRR